jgi:pilus assembly protein CpaC
MEQGGAMERKQWWLGCGQAVLAMLLLGVVSMAAAQERGWQAVATPDEQSVEVPLHKSRIVTLAAPARRVSVGNPAIADLLILQSRQVYVVGKSLGSTNVVLWDARDNVISSIDVVVTHDLDSLKEKLHRLLPGEPVAVHSSQGAIVLTGEVSSPAKMDAAMRLALTHAQEAGDQKADTAASVLNMMQVGGAQQVMLEVKVAEVARTLIRRMGIKFNAFNAEGNWTIGAVNGGATIGGPTIPGFPGGGAPIVNPGNIRPTPISIGDKGLLASFISGHSVFNIMIDAAKEDGLAKVLAEPTLTALTGQEASFLAGGEFPIPVADRDGVKITFKEFGVGLKFVPVVLDSGTISLKVNVSVSEVVTQNAAIVDIRRTAQSFFVPSLAKRSASSTVELGAGQTMGIAGLINENLRQRVDKFPGLGEIPILGALFRSQEFEKGETELVIFVTPHFAKPIAREQMRLPTDDFVEPNAVEFYLMGRIEGDPGRRPERTPAALERGGMEGRFGHQL